MDNESISTKIDTLLDAITKLREEMPKLNNSPEKVASEKDTVEMLQQQIKELKIENNHLQSYSHDLELQLEEANTRSKRNMIQTIEHVVFFHNVHR